MRTCAFLILAAVPLAAPAGAADVNLAATLVNSCVISTGTAGVMAAADSGTLMSSEESGGAPATLSVVAIGGAPTLSFSGPSLTSSPAGWSASLTTEIKYTSLGGASQNYTASDSSAALSSLTDTFTVHGRVSSSTGFAAGSYNVRTVATCSH